MNEKLNELTSEMMSTQGRNASQYLLLSSLFLLVMFATTLFGVSVSIINYQNDSYVLERDFIVSFNLASVNTSANCSISDESTLLYGKTNLGEAGNPGPFTFFIAKDLVDDGYHTLNITCADYSSLGYNSVTINKSSPNVYFNLTDLFYLITAVCVIMSIFVFKPLGFMEIFKLSSPIYYGMISITLMVLIGLGLNDLNYFYNRLPILYFIGIFICFGNVLLSIPEYIHIKMEEFQKKRLFGSENSMNINNGDKKNRW